jgi:hypothetical protein
MGFLGFRTSGMKDKLHKKENKEITIFETTINKEKEKTKAFKARLEKRIFAVNELMHLGNQVGEELKRIKNLQIKEEEHMLLAKRYAEKRNTTQMKEERNKAEQINEEIKNILQHIHKGLEIIFNIESKTKVEIVLDKNIEKELISEADKMLDITIEVTNIHKQREKEIQGIRTSMGY